MEKKAKQGGPRRSMAKRLLSLVGLAFLGLAGWFIVWGMRTQATDGSDWLAIVGGALLFIAGTACMSDWPELTAEEAAEVAERRKRDLDRWYEDYVLLDTDDRDQDR